MTYLILSNDLFLLSRCSTLWGISHEILGTILCYISNERAEFSTSISISGVLINLNLKKKTI